MRHGKVTSDGFYGSPFSYKNNEDGTFTDLVTGLTWEAKDATGGLHDCDTVFVWKPRDGYLTVEEFIAKINEEELGGQSDWRMPNVKELFTLLNFAKIDSAMCAEIPGRIPGSFYFSATRHCDHPDSVWNVDFSYGNVSCINEDTPMRVRAVRG